jgi:hypothetical protein
MSWFHGLYSTPNLVLNLQKLQSFHSRMIELWNSIPISLFLHEFFYFMKHSWKVSEPSIDQDKDASIRKYKPEAMCKTYVVMIQVVVLSISIRWCFFICIKLHAPKGIFPSRQNNNMISWSSTSPWFMLWFCRFSIPEFSVYKCQQVSAGLRQLEELRNLLFPSFCVDDFIHGRHGAL